MAISERIKLLFERSREIIKNQPPNTLDCIPLNRHRKKEPYRRTSLN